MMSTRYFTLGLVTNACTVSQHGAHIARTVRHLPLATSHTENSTEDFQSIRFSHFGQNIARPTEAFKLCLSELRLKISRMSFISSKITDDDAVFPHPDGVGTIGKPLNRAFIFGIHTL